jgi:hypothetical protein
MSEEQNTVELEAEVKRLQEENEHLRQAQATDRLPKDVEEAVREKVAAGLTRAQAVEVVKNQRAWDATNPHDPPPKKEGKKG